MVNWEAYLEEEQHGADRAVYGERILKELLNALTAEFEGFSYANLRNLRQFYLTYRDNEKCYILCGKLTWSHNRLIMRMRVENEDARSYYLNETAEQGWRLVPQVSGDVIVALYLGKLTFGALMQNIHV